MKPRISIETLADLVVLDAETGLLLWKHRPLESFPTANHGRTWNKRFAGTEALGCVDGPGYKTGSLLSKRITAHHAVWALAYGEWPSEHIDHINGKKTDNRPINLRPVSNGENRKNQKRARNNKSGQNGVKWKGARKKWIAYISRHGKFEHLGCFTAWEDAVAARKAAEAKYGYHPNHGRPTP